MYDTDGATTEELGTSRILLLLWYTSTSLGGWSIKKYSTIHGVPTHQLADVASEHVPRPGQADTQLPDPNKIISKYLRRVAYHLTYPSGSSCARVLDEDFFFSQLSTKSPKEAGDSPLMAILRHAITLHRLTTHNQQPLPRASPVATKKLLTFMHQHGRRIR